MEENDRLKEWKSWDEGVGEQVRRQSNRDREESRKENEGRKRGPSATRQKFVYRGGLTSVTVSIAMLELVFKDNDLRFALLYDVITYILWIISYLNDGGK